MTNITNLRHKKNLPLQKINFIKKLANILFIVAGIFLILHNVTPHLHHDEMRETRHNEEHQTADNLFDWLSLTFHNDMGEGHLECFSQVDDSDFQFITQSPLWNPFEVLVQLQHLLIDNTPTTSYFDHQEQKKPKSPYYFSPSPLRAPPHIA